MRISDWSSDVCSSDLLIRAQRLPVRDSPGNSTVGILISFPYIIVMLLWNLNIRHLRALAAICRLGSVSAAAQTIGLSQPAVTQGMARLELQLGRTLFERRKRSEEHTSELQSLLRIS